jgi:hypothetical protein
MKRQPAIDLNMSYAGEYAVWRIAKLLADGVHVSQVQVDDPSRRKTLSVWALADPRRFAPRLLAP